MSSNIFLFRIDTKASSKKACRTGGENTRMPMEDTTEESTLRCSTIILMGYRFQKPMGNDMVVESVSGRPGINMKVSGSTTKWGVKEFLNLLLAESTRVGL